MSDGNGNVGSGRPLIPCKTGAQMSIAEEKPSTCVGQGVCFERTRRITGYLVGTIDRFNDAKKAELRDRKTHEYGDDIS